MPLDLGGMLTRKIGPAPGWVWALGVGGLAYFLGPKLLKGGSASTTTAATGDTGMNPQSYGQGFTAGRGYMRPAASGATARSQFSLDNIPGVGAAIHAWDQAHPGIPIRSQAAATAPVVGYVPWGSTFTTSGNSVPGPGAYSGQTAAWAPTDGGYVNLDDFSQQAGATGGAGGRNRSGSIGSRNVDPHAYFHTSMHAVPRYPHFVRGGVGGAPLAHAAAVHQVAHQAEIHPARLAMLNTRPHRFVRVA